MLQSKPNVPLQERDLALLRSLFETRIMTAAHAAALHFTSSREAAKKRLQKLKAAGFIAERSRRANEPSILFLTRAALKLLQERGVLADYPALGTASFERRSQVGELTLRHELEVMDVKCAFHSALANTSQYILAECITWPLLCQFTVTSPNRAGPEVCVRPDGFLRIHERERDGGLSEHAFFLELDRSSETQDILAARAGCYLQYYKSGGYAVRNGGDSRAYRDFPFRVLMVMKTAERRNNTAERLLQNNPPILTHVYLSTLDEVRARPLESIWICPLDYRQCTEGTPYEPGRQQRTWGYKRQSAREEFVEANIAKRRLLTNDGGSLDEGTRRLQLAG